MSQIFLITSNILTIAFLIIYFLQVKKGSSIPNPSTWLIWAIVSTMNAVSFFLVTNQNFWQSLYVLLVALGLVMIFIYSLIRGRFGKIGSLEKSIVAIVLIIGIVWKTTGNADLANLSLQVIFMMSIIPTIVGLLKNQLKEKGLPWYLAVSSHAFAGLGILMSVSFNWVSLVYPLITGVLGNGAVALVVFLKNRKA